MIGLHEQIGKTVLECVFRKINKDILFTSYIKYKQCAPYIILYNIIYIICSTGMNDQI